MSSIRKKESVLSTEKQDTFDDFVGVKKTPRKRERILSQSSKNRKTRTSQKEREVRTRNFNYSFSIILGLLKTDSTERETDRYENIYYGNKRRLDAREWTKHQNSIKKLNLDCYKRKSVTRQNDDRMSKNKRVSK